MLRAAPILFLAACGGATSSFEGSTYADDETSYSIGGVGDDWERLDVEQQNDLAWSHDGSGAVIQVNSSCDPALDIPLAALTNHLLIGFTDREIAAQEVIELDGREAMQTHVTAKLDGVTRELLLTVLKKNTCVYDFALVAAPGSSFQSARSAYDSLLSGFRTEGPNE